MDDMRIPSISIIGLGALGSVLAEALVSRGAVLFSIFSRDRATVQRITASLEVTEAGPFPGTAKELGELVFLTVPDSAITEVAERLIALPGSLAGKTFVHCSGNESAGILQPLGAKGGRTASMHPMQTFTPQSVPADFEDIYFSLQGHPGAMPVLRHIAGLLGGDALEINEEQKAHMHAAAVMASNYLVTLLDASTEAGSLGGLDKEKVQKVLLPLIQTTLRNIQSASFDESISGPVVRGDIETVKSHLKLLGRKPELRELYAVLGMETVNRAEGAGLLEDISTKQLRQLLSAILNHE
ncbi:Rossmann-like and DUF2520 domain-containing protein [Fodinibius sediminis]|nr:DUF2520 domain-containing protein [Fodinibius sediminis]